MRIQHNIMAMNAYRNYSNNTSALSKNLEKLSSGYRINRAGDDAAGLAISEKMRAQITALGAAQKNVKDGISLVKTAEGATQEIHDMLNRMVSLAEQSANGTYQDKVDREAIEDEFNALKKEIDRIADASNFNGIKLLDGSMSKAGGAAAASDVDITAVADGLRGSGAAANKGKYTVDFSDLKVTADGAIADGKSVMTVEVGTVTIGKLYYSGTALTAGDAGKVLTKGDFKFSYAAGTATDTFTMGGLEFVGAYDTTTGVLTLTGKGKGGVADPTAADVEEFNKVDLSVKITEAGVKDANNGHDFAVHATNPVAAAGIDKLAQGEFKLKDGDIKDGASITIGENTYTFKVGAKGTGSGGTVIDLSAFEEGDAGIAAEAARLLSKAATTNTKFHVQTVGKDGTVRLTEKAGAFADYTEWDLQGTKGDVKDATWKNVDTGKSIVQFTKAPTSGKSLTLQIGEDSESYNKLNLDIADMHVAALGLDKHSLSTQEGAQNAVAAIKDAINKVSTTRSGLGATQNRLEHTANNLSTMKENIQDAEATIRDTDIAEEMMAYTKNNILVQSAQAMLAQANQIPQGVLQLLG